MYRKLCPFCINNSYSSYNNPQWICPYCGKNIGFTETLEPVNLETNNDKREVKSGGQNEIAILRKMWEQTRTRNFET
jgi:ribosomal protein L37AE/L43A